MSNDMAPAEAGPPPPYSDVENVVSPDDVSEDAAVSSEDSSSSLPRTLFPERPRAHQTSDTFGPIGGPFLYLIVCLLVAIVVFLAVYLINGARL